MLNHISQKPVLAQKCRGVVSTMSAHYVSMEGMGEKLEGAGGGEG